MTPSERRPSRFLLMCSFSFSGVDKEYSFRVPKERRMTLLTVTFASNFGFVLDVACFHSMDAHLDAGVYWLTQDSSPVTIPFRNAVPSLAYRVNSLRRHSNFSLCLAIGYFGTHGSEALRYWSKSWTISKMMACYILSSVDTSCSLTRWSAQVTAATRCAFFWVFYVAGLSDRGVFLTLVRPVSNSELMLPVTDSSQSRGIYAVRGNIWIHFCSRNPFGEQSINHELNHDHSLLQR
jgi:hypothetical protein